MFNKYLRAVRSLLRIPTYLLMLLYYTIACLSAAGGLQARRSWAIVLGALIIAVWYVNATAINDLSDFEIDQINLRGDTDRPLVTGALASRELLNLAVGSSLLGVLLAILLGWPALVLVSFMLALNYVYSMPPFSVSRRGGLALALLPVGYVGLTMSLGMLVMGAQPSLSALILIPICYIQFLARISLKDYRDVKGDSKFGKLTFLLRHGSPAVVRFALICHVLAAISGLTWLYGISPWCAAAYAFLATTGSVFLRRLGEAQHWPRQRVWIAAYGRIVSGQLAIILLGIFVQRGYLSNPTQEILLIITIVGTFAWSTRQVIDRLLQSASDKA